MQDTGTNMLLEKELISKYTEHFKKSTNKDLFVELPKYQIKLSIDQLLNFINGYIPKNSLKTIIKKNDERVRIITDLRKIFTHFALFYSFSDSEVANLLNVDNSSINYYKNQIKEVLENSDRNPELFKKYETINQELKTHYEGIISANRKEQLNTESVLSIVFDKGESIIE